MTVTFTAVPGLAYDSGAPAFFAVPYTVIVCPLGLRPAEPPVGGGPPAPLRHAADFVCGR